MSQPSRRLACPICRDETLATGCKGDVEVDVCPGCRGIWLDAGELDALVGKRWRGGELEARFLATVSPQTRCRECAQTHPEGTLLCTACGGVVVAYCPVDLAPMSAVETDGLQLDACPTCSGVWVDGAERKAIVAVAQRMSGTMPAARRAPQTGERQLDAPGGQSIDAIDTSGLELAREPRSAGRAPVPETVECAGCGAEVEGLRCARVEDAWWCEACVVARRVPGELSRPSVSELHAQAVTSFARANADQHEQRELNRERGRRRRRMRSGYRRNTIEDDLAVVDAIGRVFSKLKRRLRDGKPKH